MYCASVSVADILISAETTGSLQKADRLQDAYLMLQWCALLWQVCLCAISPMPERRWHAPWLGQMELMECQMPHQHTCSPCHLPEAQKGPAALSISVFWHTG